MMTTLKALSPTSRTAWAVLDTNVVLDLWLFDDSRAEQLRIALHQGRVIALTTEPMLAELADVLQRPFVAGWPMPAAQVMAAARRLCRQVEPPSIGIGAAPRCTDTDDQKFIDLAWARQAQWLISRDRAVLRLAKTAKHHGLRIVTPEGWTQSEG